MNNEKPTKKVVKKVVKKPIKPEIHLAQTQSSSL